MEIAEVHSSEEDAGTTLWKGDSSTHSDSVVCRCVLSLLFCNLAGRKTPFTADKTSN